MPKFSIMDRVITPKHPLPEGGYVLGVSAAQNKSTYYSVARSLVVSPIPFKEEDLTPYPTQQDEYKI